MTERNPPDDAARRGGSRGPRPRVRQQVLGAAQHLITTGGYAACTVDAVVSLSGVSKTTVYRWWANRAHVALDTMRAAYGWPADAVGDEPIALLRSHLIAEAAFYTGPAGAILRGVFADSQLRPPLAETLRSLYLAPRRRALEVLLRDGIAQGVLRSDLDVPIAAVMLSAPLLQMLLGDEVATPTKLPDRLVDVALAGLE